MSGDTLKESADGGSPRPDLLGLLRELADHPQSCLVGTQLVPITQATLRRVVAEIHRLGNEVARLQEVLRKIAEEHDEQRQCWKDASDWDNARYHEDRRDFALFHLQAKEGGK